MNESSWGEMIKEITDHLKEELIACTLTKDEMKVKFYTGFGGTEGKPFTAWTKNWVLFPVQYDGAESVGYVPRNPCDIASEHCGGG